VDYRPIPAIADRFLDRDGFSWNLPNVSVVVPSTIPRDDEEFVLDYMQLRHNTSGSIIVEIEVGEQRQFRLRPGDFDFEPGEE